MEVQDALTYPAPKRPPSTTRPGTTSACRIRSACPTSWRRSSTSATAGTGSTSPSRRPGPARACLSSSRPRSIRPQIYVNGKKVGQHIGGYNGFSIDVTSAIKAGDNVVAVRLNNNWNAQIPPLTGDHTFQGGLYRDVFVVVTDPLHVTWYGTWVTTPTLATNAGSSSTVAIKTEVQNNRSAAVNATLKTDIVDKDGKVVATVSSQQQIDAEQDGDLRPDHAGDQQPVAVASRSSRPCTRRCRICRTARGTVGHVHDAVRVPLVQLVGSQGFSLNGAHYWIQGGNVHQDHAGWGNGVTDSALYRDVKMVKDAGMNFIRGSHYPKAPAFADACDQLGILFWSENCFWGGFGGGPGGWSYNGAYPSTLRRFRQRSTPTSSRASPR